MHAPTPVDHPTVNKTIDEVVAAHYRRTGNGSELWLLLYNALHPVLCEQRLRPFLLSTELCLSPAGMKLHIVVFIQLPTTVSYVERFIDVTTIGENPCTT